MKFEVINAAMTAINSHVALEIARDCAAHQPDLFVVYMGNNEVIGPYGPGTVFQQWSPSRRLIRANVWLKSTRVGQLLGDAMSWLHSGKGSPTAWQGMEMFLGNQVAADDPRLTAVYDNFRQNLVDICGIARRAGAGVILSTVAVNLKDCPPLASLHRSDLSAGRVDEVEVALSSRAATGKRRKGGRRQLPSMRRRRGSTIVSRNSRFGWADVSRHWADTRRPATSLLRPAIWMLCDSAPILGSTRLFARWRPSKKPPVFVCWMRNNLWPTATWRLEAFSAATCSTNTSILRSTETICWRGACWIESARRCRNWPLRGRKSRSFQEIDARKSLALTPWDEYGMAESHEEHDGAAAVHRISSTMPLARLWRRNGWKSWAALAGTPQALAAARAVYEEALEKTPDDWQLHYRLGKLALAAGQPRLAAKHLQMLRKKLAYEASLYDSLGQAAQACGQVDEAIADYQKAIETDPMLSFVHNDLGVVLRSCGRIGEAITECRKALEIEPEYAMARVNLGIMLKDSGQTDEAIDQYQQALKSDPKQAIAHLNLGTILSEQGRLDEAITHFRAVLEIDPRSMKARNNLGNSLRLRGRLDEAIAVYQNALELDPNCTVIHYNLAIALDASKRVDEAVTHYEAALKIDPRFVAAHNNLGSILLRRGQIEEAAAHFQQALKARPDFAEARANLGKAQKMRARGIGKAIRNWQRAAQTADGRSEHRVHQPTQARTANHGHQHQSTNNTTIIGISHHFLLCRTKSKNSAARPGGACSACR